ncbi:MAG: bacillithiol system redox-active protein YtxJ, partial [Chitinophagaceae bacterium]|nr:bacillithiol system redox-active protein YtxJ [Chitinophagaceae bacterium]
MNWTPITSEDQLLSIVEKSLTKPQLIFKHSIRCSVSSMVKNRLDKGKQPEGIDFYYLDLINYRRISNKIAETFQVRHESPQV